MGRGDPLGFELDQTFVGESRALKSSLGAVAGGFGLRQLDASFFFAASNFIRLGDKLPFVDKLFASQVDFHFGGAILAF